MKELMKPIESKMPLARAFNRIVSKIQMLRIMSFPRTFEDAKGEIAVFKMQSFYDTILWEKWLHGVLDRLEEWITTIHEYFDEFSGSWEYYALSKRLDYIHEFGSDDEDDYNPDGTVKTKNITHEQLKYHTIFSELHHDCVDIVQDTKPNDLLPLINTLDTSARLSIIDVLQKVSGKEIPCYVVNKRGDLRPIGREEREERKVCDMIEAVDLGQLVYSIAQIMESITSRIEAIYNSDQAYANHHELLDAMLSDISALMQLDLKESKFLEIASKNS